MKRLLSIAVIFTMFFIGCSNEVNINNPIDNQTSVKSVSKEIPNGSRTYSSKSGSSTTVETATKTVSKEIDGSKGGFLFYGDLFKTQSGTSGNVYASCYFPAGAFVGTKTITMTLDPKTCTGTFGPSMTFDKPVIFSALFTCVDFKNVDTTSVKFVYFDKNEVKYEISSSYLFFNTLKGVMGILNAKLPHFSRYGFLR